MNKILVTNSQLTGLIARVTIALILFPHGAQKLLGWWGGHGFTATMNYFKETVNLPYPVGVLVILIEFLCPVLLLLGIGTRISSFLVFVLMVGVVITVQHSYFFMNWFGNQKGEGAEFFLLMMGLCLISLHEGGGRFSMDKLIKGKRRATRIMIPCLLLILFFMSCSPKNEGSTIDRQKKIADLYFNEVWNKGNVNLLDSLLTKDYINHTPSVPTIPGPNGLKPIIVAIRKAFPDLHFDIKEVIATEEYITIRTVMTGTQKDTLFGILPTGKHIEVNQINIERLKNGRISEHWRVTNELTMMKQLGKVK
jgi:steroid delta-isomerase-like uncharacterized protein